MSNTTFDLEPEVSNMSSVRFLETTAPVARAIQRKQLAVEVGANSPRHEFGTMFAIPGGYSVDPRHPAPVSSIAKTSVPGKEHASISPKIFPHISTQRGSRTTHHYALLPCQRRASTRLWFSTSRSLRVLCRADHSPHLTSLPTSRASIRGKRRVCAAPRLIYPAPLFAFTLTKRNEIGHEIEIEVKAMESKIEKRK